MTDQPDGDLFKAWGGCPSDVYELLMTDDHHHDRPLVHHQSARLPGQASEMLHETSAVSIFARTSALTTSCLWLHYSNTHISHLLSDIQAKERLLTV